MKYISILVVAMVLFASMLANAETNLILNPGFEKKAPLTKDETERYWVEDDDAAYWEETSWGGKRSSLYKRTGGWSLNSWGGDYEQEHGAWQGDDDNEGQTQFIPITPGTRVIFRAYIMSPDGTGVGQSPLAGGAEAFIKIEWRGTEPLKRIESAHLTGTTNREWKLYSVSGTAPAGTTAARFVAKVISVPGSSGDVYFDDLKAIIISK